MRGHHNRPPGPVPGNDTPAMDDLMAWAQQDDGFYDHPKVLALLDQGPEGLAAIGLWAVCLGWAKRQARQDSPETAGVVPRGFVRRMAGDDGCRLAQLLTDARAGRRYGLWEDHPDGWRFHDFAEWQQLAQRWERARLARAANDARWAPMRDGLRDGMRDGMPDAIRDGGPDRIATTPHHTTPHHTTKNESALRAARPEVARLCDLLADLIEGNGSKRPTVTKAWQDAIRLMLDKDGRTEREVEGAIRWCQQDEFWRGNILSAPTLRKQFDKLRLHAQRNRARGQDEKITGGVALAARLHDQERGDRR